MKKFVTLLVSAMTALSAFASSHYFVSKPALTPDGKYIYFSFSGDIYKVDRDGGLATAVVAMGGNETNPKISPDGKYLAFSSDESGDNNVYIVPTSGGEVEQLTFSDASDIPASWSSDSRNIYIESNRYNSVTTYRISLKGGTPTRLFPDYFNTVTSLVENPVTKEFIFTESAEGYSFPTRKGYKGDHNPDIQLWNPSTKEYKDLTTYNGKDIWPMCDKDGKIFFVSDRENGEANLFKIENGKQIKLTDFKESIQYPSISFNGNYIAFTKGYRLNVLDVSSGKVIEPKIDIADDRLISEISIAATDKIGNAAVSPDGKKIAYISRGLLFISDSKGNFSTIISTPKDERVNEVFWKDNDNVIYTRTNKGPLNIFSQNVVKASEEKFLYGTSKAIRSFAISFDKSKAAFIHGDKEICLLTFSDNKVKVLAENNFWSFQSYPIAFSPDDKYITYSAVNLFERDVFLCNLSNGETTNITMSANVEDSPIFSPDGKSLYFTSNRLNSSFPRGAQQRLYKVALDKYDTPYASDEYSKLFMSDKPKSDSVKIRISKDNIQRRYSSVLRGGSQFSPISLYQKEKNFILFISDHEGEFGTYILELKDWDQKPPVRVKGLGFFNTVSTNGKDIYVTERGSVYKLDPASASASKIEIKHNFSKSIRDEFRQMFYEVWSLLDQNFYDVKFHGRDWKAIKERYESYLPYVKSRLEIRTLVNDMLGELNASHMGFSTFGKDEDKPYKFVTNHPGFIFNSQNPYIVESIVTGSKADVYNLDVQNGDELIAVNGIRINQQVEREKYFTFTDAKDELSLTFKRAGKEIVRKVHTNTTQEIKQLLYTAWEDNCKAATEKLSGGKFAYVHLRDMSDEALSNFVIEMNTYGVHKQGLVLDLRYNNGGNVHREVIDFLRQKQHFRWSYRDQERVSHPNVTPADYPIIVLINERSLSDAEVTSNGIKELGIAKIVGTESYRWIIFTSGAMLVDGSSVRLPAWGCYTLDGKDLEKAGVSPDIYIKNTFKDRVESKDPQLERAIKELLSL